MAGHEQTQAGCSYGEDLLPFKINYLIKIKCFTITGSVADPGIGYGSSL
jgi:hypothetical protein